jgi:biotin-(acetyl-CoA carboxylase) ligase
LTGREIEIDVGTRRIAGRCRGIDGDGALLIQTADEMHRCYAGMVEELRESRVEN